MSPRGSIGTTESVSFVLLLLAEAFLCATEDKIAEKCEVECNGIKPLEFSENLEINGCNITCRMEQCANGCRLWNKSSNASCSESCGYSGQNMGADICVKSCSRVIRLYINEMIKEYKNAPGLVFVSSSNVSVLLRWPINPLSSLVPRFSLLQKLILGFSDDWQFHDSVSWLPGQRIKLFDLKPYVTYKFRIVVVIADDIIEPLPESLPIATEPSGTPLQAPEVVSLSTTSTSVHLKAKPPFFVNGPLIGFKLTVSRSKRYSDARVKEIITHGNSTGTISEVITMLQPDTEYELRLAAINRFGVGPELSKTVRTLSQNQVQTAGYLLYCADNKLLKQDLGDIFGKDSDVLFEDPNEAVLLTEIAIHFARQLIFVATNNGHVYRISANEKERSIRNISSSVITLTTDWLHDHLYLATSNTIFKCNLNMDSCHVVMNIDNSSVIDMHVDPCNGYLYWTQKGLRNGLFSLDLDSLEAFSFEPRAIAIGIIEAFAIDYTNYRLFFLNKTIHSIISIYLDGTDPINVRTNTQNPDFSSITGLAYDHLNYTFYWTDGKRLMMEAYDVVHDLYHHNPMPAEGRFGGVEVWGTGAQPIPVPILPPRNLQALFSQTSALVSWLPPESNQGRGAWQQWQYEVEVLNIDAGTNRSLSRINSTRIKIENLESGALYSFRVCGTSAGGIGPWSEYFMAHMLATENSLVHVLLYASGQGVFEKALDGTDARMVVNSNFTTETITELTSYNGKIYLTTQAGQIFEKPRRLHDLRALEIKDVGVLAFDWLTNQLYWTNTKLNLIKRMPLKDEAIAPSHSVSREETVVYASSAVQDLILDVAEARMYWATSSTVETAYLDGQDHLVVQKLPIFSSQYVLGVAMESSERLLYWMVKNVDRLIIREVRLASLDGGADFQSSLRDVVEFPGKVMHPSLECISSKLFWIGPKNELSVLDLKSLSIARLQLAAENESQVLTFKVVPPFDREPTKFLSNATSLVIIPEIVDSDSVFITEFGNFFNISWNPSTVDRGRVHYRVWILVDGYHRLEKQTFSPFTVPKELRLYSEIEINVTACSYWGCGPPVHKIFHSLLAEKSVQGQLTFALSTSLGVILTVTMVIICVLFITCLGQKNRKTIFSIFDANTSSQRRSEHELATLTHLPPIALETMNVLYASSFLPGNEEIACLPHFPHGQLWLTKFLGSGAFGKVFEGIAVNILGECSGETKVAVKTLHKSASDNEKEGFLQEALLMNNFKHDHILRLLGVCLSHDPQFLILELMDGGDLLTFLRASRPSFVTDVKLTMSDMMGICMDVGKGCEYLEDMHFVHRDLAARNCLISFIGSSLIVKIGDFGLARDIYRNDYYKKEGEGLLPVRWMSPESLIDGIFTTQSDVWAYGVLMWEVITLGQQPYPAQTNLEVLHFVRSGGRLDCPENCPNDLYQLMLKCWLYLPLKRPSFHDIVRQLKVLSQITATTTSAVLSSDINSPPVYDRPSAMLHHQRQSQRKSQYSSEDHSSFSPGRFIDQRHQTGFDPMSLDVQASENSSVSCVRLAKACHSSCDGHTCGYLQPSHEQNNSRHPKYLELTNSSNSSQEDT